MCILLYAWEETSSAACQYRCASVFWENQGALRGQCDRGGSCFCEPRDTCSLSPPCPPPSNFLFFFVHWTTNALLPWGVVTQGGMRGYHLLFINTGSGNTPHCQPNPLSLHLVPWQGGRGVCWWCGGAGWGGVDQVQRPRCSAKGDDRVFTPLLQLWMRGWWRQGAACVCVCVWRGRGFAVAFGGKTSVSALTHVSLHCYILHSQSKVRSHLLI